MESSKANVENVVEFSPVKVLKTYQRSSQTNTVVHKVSKTKAKETLDQSDDSDSSDIILDTPEKKVPRFSSNFSQKSDSLVGTKDQPNISESNVLNSKIHTLFYNIFIIIIIIKPKAICYLDFFGSLWNFFQKCFLKF